jgi:hypothetical protein
MVGLFLGLVYIMTSLPCFEILGLARDTEHTPEAIDAAYERLKAVVGTVDDVESAYETLRASQTRAAYILNWVPFKGSEWSWAEYEDGDGVWRSLVRQTKALRQNAWSESDGKGRRDIKKQKQNDRKGNRDKRRDFGGYDD